MGHFSKEKQEVCRSMERIDGNVGKQTVRTSTALTSEAR